MDEDTTTSAPAEQGGQEPQPEAPAVQPEAEQTPNAEPENDAVQQPNEPVEQPQADPEQEQLAQFAKTKGIELDSENAIKAAKMAMNAEKLMHQKSAKASELEKALQPASDEYAEQVAVNSGNDPEVIKRLQRIEVRDAIGQFWSQDGLDRSLEPEMVKILAQKPHLAGDLDALYAVAERQVGSSAASKSKTVKETLTKLAHNQQAAVPRGNATNANNPPKKDFNDLSVEEMEKRLGFVAR